MDRSPLSPLRDVRDPGPPLWDRMERDLVNAFQHQEATPTTSHAPSRLYRWHWMAAAAVVLLAAAITFYPGPTRRGVPTKPAEPPSPPSQPATTSEPPVSPPLASPKPAKPRRPATPPIAPQRSPAAAMNEFVPLPGAFALPAFESGRIVRWDVPMTVLPAYGIALVPDGTPTTVPADFLIGQDGVPRAIRRAAHSQQ